MTSKLLIVAIMAIMFLNGCNNNDDKKENNNTTQVKNTPTQTLQVNNKIRAGVNGCSYEELAYSNGYAEGTKAINQKDHDERNVALYILKGGCNGYANTYNMLKKIHPDKYPQSADSIFGLCLAGSQNGFDKKKPQDYYKKECENKPLIDKSEYK